MLSRIISALRDVLELDAEAIKYLLMVGNLYMPHYLHSFVWNEDMYPTTLTMNKLLEILSKQASSTMMAVKDRLTHYDILKKSLESMVKTQRGSLITRNIAPLVKKDHFVLGSKNLVTVVVVVKSEAFSDWMNLYELLNEEVVPRSSKLLFKDKDFGLFSVTLFKRSLKTFTLRAREMHFFVRDFAYNEESVANENQTFQNLKGDVMNHYKPLVHLLKTSFNKMYVALAHVYAMKMFVECTLRYGLPANYVYAYLMVPKNKIKKLRQSLGKQFAYLDKAPPVSQEKKKQKDALYEDYYPYVYTKLRVDVSHF